MHYPTQEDMFHDRVDAIAHREDFDHGAPEVEQSL
jgi:hypothetical protein